MNCADCYFGRKPGEAFNNSCHRNPLPVYASTAHWCGEHKPIDQKPVLRLPTKK